MSMIIVMGNSKQIYMAGDGRVSNIDEQENMEILYEDEVKVHKISNHILVGYAGNSQDCYNVMENARSIMVSKNPNFDYADIFLTFCKSAMEKLYKQTGKSFNAQLLIAGLTLSHTAVYYMLKYDEGKLTVDTQQLTNEAYHYQAISCIDGDTSWAKQILERSMNIEENLRECIKEASRRFPAINDHITIQTLKFSI